MKASERAPKVSIVKVLTATQQSSVQLTPKGTNRESRSFRGENGQYSRRAQKTRESLEPSHYPPSSIKCKRIKLYTHTERNKPRLKILFVEYTNVRRGGIRGKRKRYFYRNNKKQPRRRSE